MNKLSIVVYKSHYGYHFLSTFLFYLFDFFTRTLKDPLMYFSSSHRGGRKIRKIKGMKA